MDFIFLIDEKKSEDIYTTECTKTSYFIVNYGESNLTIVTGNTICEENSFET